VKHCLNEEASRQGLSHERIVLQKSRILKDPARTYRYNDPNLKGDSEKVSSGYNSVGMTGIIGE
jgi:hypothetical protein